MQADYPGAIVVEAANYGYSRGGYSLANQPKTWGFHTPEEPADSHPSTPAYLATTDRDASYTYFVSYLGFIFQLVPEDEGAYAHGLEGKPEPPWSDGSNLNLQTLSLSFEGYTATIPQTMPRGCPQWNAGVDLVAHRTKALGLNLDIAFQHKEVSIYRGDCGQWDQAAFIADVRAKMEDDMGMTAEETARMDSAFSQIAWLRSELNLAHQFDASQEHGSATWNRLAMLTSQVSWLRAELGLDPEFDPSQAHDSTILHRIAEVEGSVGAGPQDGLKRGDTVNLTGGTLE